MIFFSIPDWLREQERKKKPAIFLLEWISIFACAILFWTTVLLRIENSFRSTAAAAAISALYACGFVYLRIYPVTRCKKCKSLLPFIKKEVSRRYIHDVEKYREIERGGEDYWAHFIDIYNRIYHIDIVKFRCHQCKGIWEEKEQSPASKYKFIRTINVKD